MPSSTTDAPLFGRVITAMVTPFDTAGRVDYDGAVRLAEYLIDNGSDGLVLSGTTGESPTLTHDEKVQLFKTVKQAIGSRAKILAGTGSYSTNETIELSQAAERCGVDGLLVVSPYYNKPSQEGIYQHFTAVADATSIPIMLYNVPARTASNMDASTTARLSEHPRILGIKEASLNDTQVGEIHLHAREGFGIYSGADEVNLTVLALGGVGTVSVISHLVGKDLMDMVLAFEAGDIVKSRQIHLRTLALTKAMFSFPSPTPTKTALEILGVLSHSYVRQPHVPATEKERSAVQAALRDYGLIKG